MEIRVKEGKSKPTSSKQAAPKKPTSSNTAEKGDMVAPGADPLSVMTDAFMSLLGGGMPNPAMGGGQTVMPKGTFTQQPSSEMLGGMGGNPMGGVFGDQANDMSILTSMLDPVGATPQANIPEMPVPPRNPLIQQGQPTMAPSMPVQNPLFHAPQDSAGYGQRGEISGANDMRSIGMILNEMFGDVSPGIVPPNPQRNPMFTGGV